MVVKVWRIRENGENFDYDELYASEPSYFSLKIHHGGFFTDKPGRRYVNGNVNFMDLIDIDTFSVHELHYMMKELGYKRKEAKYYHFLVPDYCMVLKSRNLGTTVKIEVEENSGDEDSRVFKKIYICLGALKRQFKTLGRDPLGLDGAFMKGPYPGILLTAVGLDLNNDIYPMTYAIVEARHTIHGHGFLSCIQDDLELEERSIHIFK